MSTRGSPLAEVVLAGNSLALVVAACVLGRRGRRVRWVTDARKPGGYFAGLRVGEDAFDLGSVLLERPGPDGPQPDLQTYDPARRYDSARFSGLSWEFLESLLSTRRVPTAECALNGRRCPDYLLSNRLDGFAGLNLAVPSAAAQAGVAHPWHASHKLAAGSYDSLDYADAALHNHGRELHAALIEPFMRKLTGAASWPLMARFHRTGWLPLYYPETIALALAGQPVGLAEYPFWLPAEGWCGSLVEALLTEVEGYSCVQRVDSPIAQLDRHDGGFVLTLANGEVLPASVLALGVPNERAHGLLSLPAPLPMRAVGIRLLLLRVRAGSMLRPASCLMVPDAAFSAYRISDMDAMSGRDVPWHRVVIEASIGAGHAPFDAPVLDAQLQRELCQLLGIEDPADVVQVRGLTVAQSLSLPSCQEVDTACVDLARLHESARGVLLCGGLAGFGATSLHDHIVQGLVMAQRLQG